MVPLSLQRAWNFSKEKEVALADTMVWECQNEQNPAPEAGLGGSDVVGWMQGYSEYASIITS